MNLSHLQEKLAFSIRLINQYLVTGGYILLDSLPADPVLTQRVIVTADSLPYPASSYWLV